MKQYLSLFIVFVSVLSCTFEAPVSLSEEYNPTDEELFPACSDLQGVGQFIVGKSTYKTVINDPDYQINVGVLSSSRESNFFNGHWGYAFWDDSESSIGVSLDKSRLIEKESKGRIKQLITRTSGHSITIGGLEFKEFDMAFLNDTLVAIYFEPTTEIEDKVIMHYKQKYGDGRGHFKYSKSMMGSGEKATIWKEFRDEVRTWANDRVILDYVYEEDYDAITKSYFEDLNLRYEFHPSYTIYSKTRYPVFVDYLMSLAKLYDEEEAKKQQQKESTLNSM